MTGIYYRNLLLILHECMGMKYSCSDNGTIEVSLNTKLLLLLQYLYQMTKSAILKTVHALEKL